MRTPILDQPLITVAGGHVEKVDRYHGDGRPIWTVDIAHGKERVDDRDIGFDEADPAVGERRLREMGKEEREAEELVDTIDQDPITFLKHYFNADWPTRCLYHMMINTAIGDESVISTVLNTMQTLEHAPAHV